jgi:LPXTG-site transpeptidase (sortase) family protein
VAFIGNKQLRIVNYFLSAAIIGIALYLILWPFLPQFSWWFHHDVVKTPTQSTKVLIAQHTNGAKIPEQNTLIIPALGVYQPINEGNTIAAVAHKGLWRRPNGSTPDQHSNTVIVGHRFSYSGNGEGVFYNLDKLKGSDLLTVYWNRKPYVYQVFSTQIVDPSDLTVEAASKTPILTVYTCTPLWTSKNRLVVQAKYIGDQP